MVSVIAQCGASVVKMDVCVHVGACAQSECCVCACVCLCVPVCHIRTVMGASHMQSLINLE